MSNLSKNSGTPAPQSLVRRSASQMGVKQMDLTSSGSVGPGQSLEELTLELVEVLEKINRIRPVQFHDYESDYVYNFLGVRDWTEDKGCERIFIEVSGVHDNLPSHAINPLKDGRNHPLLPYPDFP